MPITKREFELGIDSEIKEFMEKIYDFLKLKKNLAFSASELGKELSVGTIKLDKALEVLVGIGAIEQRKIRGEIYYAFSKEFNKETWGEVVEEAPF